MMMRFKLAALGTLGALTLLSVPSTEAHSSIEPISHAKPTIQAIVHADGSVVDRIKLPAPPSLPIKHLKPKDALPDSPEAWLTRMMDPTRHGLVVKQPELFDEWLDAITEPRFMTALASVMLTPETYSNTLGRMVDPATVRNLAEFADPLIYLRWMATGFDPNFYQAIFNRLTEAGKLQRWGIYSYSIANARHEKSAKSVVTELSKRSPPPPTAQDWMHLSTPDSNANPWLMQSMNYRY